MFSALHARLAMIQRLFNLASMGIFPASDGIVVVVVAVVVGFVETATVDVVGAVTLEPLVVIIAVAVDVAAALAVVWDGTEMTSHKVSSKPGTLASVSVNDPTLAK